MPELPEVETTRCGIAPVLVGSRIAAVNVRDRRLRWPVSAGIEDNLAAQTVTGLRRRAKYLLLETGAGTAVMHLGMSGSIRIVEPGEPPEKHDHFDITTEAGDTVRFNDPRRFGAFFWAGADAESHPLLRDLGPVLVAAQTGDQLAALTR